MEHHAQSADDVWIGGLSYKLKPGASYVTNRRSVSYFASGGSQYSPNGVKVMKFNLTGDQWMDPSTCHVMFQLNNAGNVGAAEGSPTKALEPLSWNPFVFFRRARIICGGVVVEDIDNFNRLSLMLTALKTEEEQHFIASEGFCNFGENTLKLQLVLVRHIVPKITTNLDLLLFLAELFSSMFLDFQPR